MHWEDEGYLLSKTNFSENSIIIEAFTMNHGKYSGIVYGGSSRKNKKIYQIGNKMLFNLKSKTENKIGYFNVELIKPVAPKFFENKKKSICILAIASILKILLPERQVNKKIFISLEQLINQFDSNEWIKAYISWELFLIKELGFAISFTNEYSSIKQALAFNKNLLMKNFIIPNKLSLPLSRNILQNYYD